MAFDESGQILPLQSSPPEWSPGTRTLSEDFQQDQQILRERKREREKERERERERERWDKKGGIVESRIRVFVCLIVVA